MFFIGVFGINDAQKPIGTYSNVVCPSCGAYTHFEILKAYTYFHIFFIPTFKWNIRYFVKPACCGNIYELDPSIGAQYEKGQSPEIRNEHLIRADYGLPYKICENCGARFDPSYNFCPYCGRKF